MSDRIPLSHVELLTKPIIATLVTLLPNGYPHATPVWCSYDGEHIWINTAEGRQKDKDMQANPHVTVVVFDPDDVFHWLEVRGDVVERTYEGAVEHIEQLSQQYEGKPYYGGTVSAEQRSRQTRVIYKIRPVKVTHGR